MLDLLISLYIYMYVFFESVSEIYTLSIKVTFWSIAMHYYKMDSYLYQYILTKTYCSYCIMVIVVNTCCSRITNCLSTCSRYLLESLPDDDLLPYLERL